MKTGKILFAVGAMVLAVAYVAIPFGAGAADSNIYIGRGSGQVAAKVSGTIVDGGSLIQNVRPTDNTGTPIGTASSPIRTDPTGTTSQPATYAGPWESAAGTCVLCGTSGDGGTITTAVGTRYVVRVVDSNGSPATATENGPCIAYGSAGMTIPANAAAGYAGPTSTADGGAPYLTCCAQTETASPAGPWLCATPLQ